MIDGKKDNKLYNPEFKPAVEKLRDAIFKLLHIPQIVKWLSKILK